MITIHEKAEKILNEPCFEIFKHEGFICCIQRLSWAGNLNGYVSIPKDHPFYGKKYSDEVVVGDLEEIQFNGNYLGLLCNSMKDTPSNMLSIDLAINVHGGITYSRDQCNGIEDDLFGKLWWFGFDTIHSGDLKPYQTDIDRKFTFHSEDEYRTFEYVKGQTKQLAEQLSKYGKKDTLCQNQYNGQ